VTLAVEARGVGKRHGPVVAVEDLTFDVPAALAVLLIVVRVRRRSA
jgi:hypothetical protein